MYDVMTAPQTLELLPQDFFVTSAACGLCSSYFVTDQGRVLFCGIVAHTSTPFKRPRDNVPVIPTTIPGLPTVRQVSVSLDFGPQGHEHVFFQTEEKKEIYGWGHTGHGELLPVEGGQAPPPVVAHPTKILLGQAVGDVNTNGGPS